MNWAVLGGTVLATAVLRNWWGLLIPVPLIWVVYRANRHRAVHLSRDVRNVGELVIYMTDFAAHRDSGYRWTRNEIELKVRFTLVDSLGVDLDEIRPECTLRELGAY